MVCKKKYFNQHVNFWRVAPAVLFIAGIVSGCNKSVQTNTAELPVTLLDNEKPVIISFNEGMMIWDISRVPDRDQTRIEFPHLTRFDDFWYSSFREGEIHGNHITGRARVIRSADGVHWENVALFESETGDVRDPRLSVTTDGKLMLNASIKFIEEVAPYETAGDETIQRQSVTWLSSDGLNWSDLYACPTGINTWRWDVTWYDNAGYSIGYSGKDAKGALYRTYDGKTWETVQNDLFPGGYGNEAALTFGKDGTLYVLLRAGLNAKVALGSSPPPHNENWEWTELDAYWDDFGNRQPVKTIPGFERDLGGPKIITLDNGKLLGAGRVRGEIRIALFFIDPEEAVLTRIVGIDQGSSYPGIAEYEEDLYVTYIGHVTGEGPVYILRLRFPD